MDYTAVSVWLLVGNWTTWLLLLVELVAIICCGWLSAGTLDALLNRLFRLACFCNTLCILGLDEAWFNWTESTPWRKALTTRIMSWSPNIMSISCLAAAFPGSVLIVNIRYIRCRTSQMATRGAQAMHAVTRPFFFHIFQSWLECSDYS